MPLTSDQTVEKSPALTYDRTLDRVLVNRRTVAEVFLTDYLHTTEFSFVCGAQLPQYHAYFSDHLVRPESYDLLLLLECCRQAATYGGYHHFGNARDSVNLVGAFDIELTDTAPLTVGHRPGELTMLFRLGEHDTAGTKRRGTLRADMLIDGAAVGWASIDVKVVKTRTYEALRRRQVGGDPPSTRDLPAVPPGEPVAPRRAGRESRANVLLTDAVVESGSVTARLGLPARNRSILDHDYDHYPAMSLVEAGRQAGLLALADLTGDPDAAARMRPVTLRAVFGRFAELAEPVVVRAWPADETPGRPGAPISLTTQCSQSGQPIATATITYQPVGG